MGGTRGGASLAGEDGDGDVLSELAGSQVGTRVQVDLVSCFYLPSRPRFENVAIP